MGCFPASRGGDVADDIPVVHANGGRSPTIWQGSPKSSG